MMLSMHLVLYFEDCSYAPPLSSFVHPAFFPVFGRPMLSYVLEAMDAEHPTWYVWGATEQIRRELARWFPTRVWHDVMQLGNHPATVIYADMWLHRDDIRELADTPSCLVSGVTGYLGQLADGDSQTRTLTSASDGRAPWIQGAISLSQLTNTSLSPLDMLQQQCGRDVVGKESLHVVQRIRYPWDVLSLQYQLLQLADIRHRIDPSAHIDDTVYLGDNVVIGAHVHIAEHVELSHVTILDHVHIEPNCRIDGSVLGEGVTVREHTIVDGSLGEQNLLLGQDPTFRGVFAANQAVVEGFVTTATILSPES